LGSERTLIMQHLRQWELNKSTPHELHLAADARLSQTDYTDDQIWNLEVGTHDNPALSLHTKYGGRAGLVSLVPMWLHEGRVIYQAQTYQQAPTITAFAPGYIAAEATLLPQLTLEMAHIAFDSHTIGGIYSLQNNSSKPIELRFDLFGHLGKRGKEQKLAIITLAEGGHALSLTTLVSIAPVVMVEHGNAGYLTRNVASPKVGVDLSLNPGETYDIRWVHAGLGSIYASIAAAQAWLNADWQPYLQAIDEASQAIPTIQTGNLEWDALIASSYNRVVQAFLRPSGHFPNATFVANRLPEYGYSYRGDGSDHVRSWNGQDVSLAYLLLPVMANIDPQAVEGALQNYLALQTESGFIDLKPGPVGQRQDLLCTPILARIAWAIYEQTQNTAFIKSVFPGLLRFFTYWFQMDADGDGTPEWQDDRQTHYVAFPTFAPGMVWAQGADIQHIETPDLLGYLLSEARSLQQMAERIDEKSAHKQLTAQIQQLQQALSAFWQNDHYLYRDRDTHLTLSGQVILEDGIGDEEHFLVEELSRPNRLIIRIVGGVKHIPNITLHIDGVDTNGQEISERIRAEDIRWQNRQGIYTTQSAFSQVNRIYCEGLSRVYRVFVQTVDLTRIDINALLPLWSGLIPDDNAQKIAALAFDKKRFLCPNGITMTDQQGDLFDPTNAEGAGGIWFYWQTLLGEALLNAGYGDKVTELVKNHLKLLTDVLVRHHEFAQFYDSDQSIPLGEKGHIAGIAPLHLLHRLMGVQILSHQRVCIAAEFAWGRGITIRQHGVYVRRTNKGVKIEFASGHTRQIKASQIKNQIFIEDPKPVAKPKISPIKLTGQIEQQTQSPPTLGPKPEQPRVIIEVEHED